MKKLFTTLITLGMVFAMAGTAFASDEAAVLNTEEAAAPEVEAAAETLAAPEAEAAAETPATMETPAAAEPVATTEPMTTPAATTAGSITKTEAVSIALKNAKLKKSKIKRLRTEFDDEENVYEVEFIKKKNRAEYDYEISAKDGRILQKSVEYKYKHSKSKKKIGKKKARKIAAKRAKVSYAAVKKGICRYEYDDGEGTYEIRFAKGSYNYEYEVLAPTGRIIEYSYKYIKR